MSEWRQEELERIERTDEIGIASRRADGAPRGYVTIWAVRVGDEIYVRSANGYDNPWFQRALRSGVGRIRAGRTERDVTFEVPEPDVADTVTAAYHAKYDRYGPKIVGSVTSTEAARSTIRVNPI